MAKARSGQGSITKELPFETIAQTIALARPGETYSQFRTRAAGQTHADAPGIVRGRFLLIQNDRILYDHFLSLVQSEGFNSPILRKAMYFTWMMREPRIRQFVCETIANRQGHWRVNQLTRKQNADFFINKGFTSSEQSASKSRSNFEYFVHELNIFRDGQIDLDLSDGWLEQGMTIAAQHVQDAATRRAMVADPGGFLVARGWHGLANATVEELQNLELGQSEELDPIEDETITTNVSADRAWNRQEPASRTTTPTQVTINQVALERANRSHFNLEQMVAQSAQRCDYAPLFNVHIDLHFTTPNGNVLIEVKSCHQGNLHSQVRRGVSQLFEYAYVYREMLGNDVKRVLVIETEPTTNQKWLLDYLASINITLIWRDGDRLVTSHDLPTALAGLFEVL